MVARVDDYHLVVAVSIASEKDLVTLTNIHLYYTYLNCTQFLAVPQFFGMDLH